MKFAPLFFPLALAVHTTALANIPPDQQNHVTCGAADTGSGVTSGHAPAPGRRGSGDGPSERQGDSCTEICELLLTPSPIKERRSQ